MFNALDWIINVKEKLLSNKHLGSRELHWNNYNKNYIPICKQYNIISTETSSSGSECYVLTAEGKKFISMLEMEEEQNK